MLTRRQMITLGMMSVVPLPERLLIQPETVTEQQKGDPADDYESVTFDPEAIRGLSQSAGRAVFEKWDSRLPAATVIAAKAFVGASRATTPATIAQFLALFNLPMKDAHGPLAFCAAGISFCALTAYAKSVKPSTAIDSATMRKLCPDLEHYYFYPTVSCVDMYHIAAGKRRWVDHKSSPATLPQPGWIVLFDWAKRGSPDHCGLVDFATTKELLTVEFNTSVGEGSQRNGGVVAAKKRTYDFVYGYIVTDARPSNG